MAVVIREAFSLSAIEADWNSDSRVAVLLDFIEREQRSDRLVVERFQAYLDERLDEEESYMDEEGPCIHA